MKKQPSSMAQKHCFEKNTEQKRNLQSTIVNLKS